MSAARAQSISWARLRQLSVAPEGPQQLIEEAAEWLGGATLALRRGDVWILVSAVTMVPSIAWPSVGLEEFSLHSSAADLDRERLERVLELLFFADRIDRERRASVEAKECYAALLDASFEGIVVSDAGVCIEANTAITEIYGYTREELIGRSVLPLAAPEVHERIRQVFATGYTGAYETIAVRKDGVHVPLEVRGKPTIWRGRPVRVAAFRDLRKEKQIEADLVVSEQRLREAQSNARVGSFSYPRHGAPWWSDEMFALLDVGRDTAPLSPDEMAQHLEGRQGAAHFVERLTCFDGATERWELEVVICGTPERTLLVLGRFIPNHDAVSGTMQDISARKLVEAQMLSAKEEALEASRIKSRFLANMSHEIRTPMNGVMGLTRLLLDSPLTADQRHLAATVLSSAESLQTIIDDILDLTKIEEQRVVTESCPFDLKAVVEQSMLLVHSTARENGLRLESWFGSDVGRFQTGDQTRLQQVLVNLLSNAVKFTDEGTVRLIGRLESGWLALEISDTGIGMTAEERALVFDPFVQADVSTTRRFGGTGLGLSISRGFVEAMGGTLSLVSEPGVGTTFTVRLPDGAVAKPSLSGQRVVTLGASTNLDRLSKALTGAGAEVSPGPGAPDAWVLIDAADVEAWPASRLREYAVARPTVVVANLGELTDWRERGLAGRLQRPVFLEELIPALFSPMRGPVHVESKASYGLRILVAEDNAVNQLVTRRMLESLGNTVVVVGNGALAVAAMGADRFDLVLMDLQMPEMDGLEATAAIRRLAGESGRITIVALTANAMAGDRQRCLDAGMDDFISKPVHPKAFRSLLERLSAEPTR